jgi:catechol 2,3-dioxygenase-like lactoylglutathione lyase family enzyme
MTVELNHTIVHARDKAESARFLSEVLGVGEPHPFPPFLGVQVGGVTMDFIDAGDYEYSPQHYAFLVSEDEFDAIFGRIRERRLDYWADPHRQQPGEINHHFGGRGVYWCDPGGHLLEIITQPYDTGA